MRLYYLADSKVEHKRYVVTSAVALAALTAIAGTAAVAGGTYAGINAMANPDNRAANAANDIKVTQERQIAEQKAAIEQQTKDAAEAPGKAQDAAKTALEKRRRIQMLSGGDTLLAGETVSSTKGKTLLGS